jgi:hypothetical protein
LTFDLKVGWSILNAEALHRDVTPKQNAKGITSMRHQDKMKIRRRRIRKLFWLFAAAAVCALLFEEQAAVLYVLATLATCGLLIVVAISNLEGRDADMQTAAIRADDMSTNSTDFSRVKRRAA